MTGPTLRKPTARFGWTRWLLLIAMLVVLGFFFAYRDRLSFETFASHERELRDWVGHHHLVALAGGFVIFFLIAASSLPGTSLLTIVMGWLFTFPEAVALVSFAATSGAVVSFLMSRYLFRDLVEQRFAVRAKLFETALNRDGAFYLLTLRMVPFPFMVVNLAMGLTRIRVWTFTWVSQLGMLPKSMVFIYLGSTLKGLSDPTKGLVVRPGLVIAFALIALTPIASRFAMRWVLGRRRKGKQGTSPG